MCGDKVVLVLEQKTKKIATTLGSIPLYMDNLLRMDHLII